MKEISVSLWEMSIEELKGAPKDKQILVYESGGRNYSVFAAEEILTNIQCLKEKGSERTYYFSFEE